MNGKKLIHALAWLLPWLGLTLTTHAQDEWEWEAGEGFHEEEWYDPSDWFNEDSQVSYEYDAWDAYQPYEYGGDYRVDDDEWEYGYHYDEPSNEWTYGYHYEPYDEDYDYGWHYDELADDWSYGYHYDEYEYYTDDWWL